MRSFLAQNGCWTIRSVFLLTAVLFCPLGCGQSNGNNGNVQTDNTNLNTSHGNNENGHDDLEEDLIVDGEKVAYGIETLNVQGNVIIRNGGELVLEGTTLNINSSFEEEFILHITGDSRLTVTDATLAGVGHQTALIAEPQDAGSPQLVFTRTTVTGHAGIRPYGSTRVTSVDSDIEEIQVHDQVQVSVTGGEGTYPVFFFDDRSAELVGLVTGPNVSRTASVPGGWSFTLTDTEVDGYQIDVEGDANVTLVDCQGITASIHTPGDLGDDEVILQHVSTNGPEDGAILGLGAEIVYQNTAIDIFNIYLSGSDRVRIEGGVVNEANTEDESQLTIVEAEIVYNLVQAYGDSALTIENCTITADDSVQPSLTAEDHGVIRVHSSDCERLSAQAIGSGRIEFAAPIHLDLEQLSVQDQGEIYIDGARVR